MESVLSDIRLALRHFRNNLGFTVVAVLTLALGIGANTTIFSVVNAVLLKPLPYRDPGGLTLLWEVFPGADFDFLPSSEINFPIWREEFDAFSSISGFKFIETSITSPGQTARVSAWAVSSNLLETLDVRVELGRGFLPKDGRPGAARVVLLSHDLWAARFSRDQQAVGRVLWLNGIAHEVIGVLPRGFFFPPPLAVFGETHELAGEVFIPNVIDPEKPDPRRNLAIIGRLNPDFGRPEASARAEGVASQLASVFPRYNPPKLGVRLVSLHDQAVSESLLGLGLLSLSVVVILLIACVNVANLFLARGALTSREVAIRTALGAGRGRLIRQFLVESLCLAALGGMIGLLMAFWGVDILLTLTQGHIPRMGPVGFDFRVLAFAWAVTAITGIVAGLVPALRGSQPALHRELGAGRAGVGGIGKGYRSGLLVAEVAFAVVLLVVAGLLLRSFWELRKVEHGFQIDNAVKLDLNPPQNRYPEAHQVRRLYALLREELSSLPGVESVGAVSGLPLSGDRSGVPIEIEGRPTSTLEEYLNRLTALRICTPGYFRAMGIPLLKGRTFVEADREDSRPVVIVDEELAARFWPQGSALGARIAFEDDARPDAVWREVVGIVGGVRQETLDKSPQFVGTVYIPLAQFPNRGMSLVVRTRGTPESTRFHLRLKLQEIDPELAFEAEPLSALVWGAQAERRSPTILLGAMACLAVVLALVGLYGVTSFVVGQRTAEIGLRMALGATRGSVLRLVLLQSSRWVLGGLVIGVSAALLLSPLLSAFLFGIAATDPWTYLVVAALFVSVAGLAGLPPASRASRVEPHVALKAE